MLSHKGSSLDTELEKICIGESYDMGLRAFSLDPWGTLPSEVFEGDNDAYGIYSNMCKDFESSFVYFFDNSFDVIEKLYKEEKFLTTKDIIAFSEEYIVPGDATFEIRSNFKRFVAGDNIAETIKESCVALYEKRRDEYINMVVSHKEGEEEPAKGPNPKLQ